jgi:hypothetical protein
MVTVEDEILRFAERRAGVTRVPRELGMIEAVEPFCEIPANRADCVADLVEESRVARRWAGLRQLKDQTPQFISRLPRDQIPMVPNRHGGVSSTLHARRISGASLEMRLEMRRKLQHLARQPVAPDAPARGAPSAPAPDAPNAPSALKCTRA